MRALSAAARCLEQASPNVGRPYRERLERLRDRLSFDPTRESLEAGAENFEAELKDYATVASGYLKERSVELERGLLALSEIIERLGRSQEVFSFRLQQFAAQMESAVYPSKPEDRARVVALQAAELRGSIASQERETATATKELFECLTELDRRLAGTECLDPVTGLINAREFNRQVEAHAAQGIAFSVLRFKLGGYLSDQVMRQAAGKLSARFRHRDRIARWSDREFAVLVVSDRNLAEQRAAETAASLAGRYTLDNDETVEITAQASQLEPEAVLV